MATDTNAAATPKAMLWAGWIMTGLVSLFLAMDLIMKLLKAEVVVQTTTTMQLPESMIVPIGVIELGALALYLYPRTALLGAVLWTGVFGGAIASHWRLGDPLFSHTLFGLYLGILVWGGLWLRDARVRAVMPFVR